MKTPDCGENTPGGQTFQLQEEQNAGDTLDMYPSQCADGQQLRQILSLLAELKDAISRKSSQGWIAQINQYWKVRFRMNSMSKHLETRIKEYDEIWQDLLREAIAKPGLVVLEKKFLEQFRNSRDSTDRLCKELQTDMEPFEERYPKQLKRLVDAAEAVRRYELNNFARLAIPFGDGGASDDQPSQTIDFETLANGFRGV